MDIVITGSVAYDYLMTFPGSFQEQILPDQIETISLSFLVDSLVRQRGGVAPNIAYTYALLGGRPKVFATVGEDFAEYRAWLDSHGVDTTWAKVIEGKYTASFFATTDQHNRQLASFYPGAMEHAGDISLKDLPDRPDLVVVSPNEPGAMAQYIEECKQLGVACAYDPSQQLARMAGEDLRRDMPMVQALFVNEYEFGLIENKTGWSKREILQQVEFAVVTRGEAGASVYAGGQEINVPAVPPSAIVDPTGAGDAFRGGFLTGYSRGWDWALCAQIGALAGTYCLENSGPQSHHYTIEEFVTRFRQHYDDGGKLDELM